MFISVIFQCLKRSEEHLNYSLPEPIFMQRGCRVCVCANKLLLLIAMVTCCLSAADVLLVFGFALSTL